MLTFAKITVAAALAAVAVGCTTAIDVIRPDAVVTNTVSMKAFQDESYVWETWQYSTNRSDAVIK